MNAVIIVNRHAGGAADVDAEALVGALGSAGYEAEARFTSDLGELDAALDETEGLVVSVGGDGTLRAIALRMRGRDRPLAIVPLGTANNVAAALGLTNGGSPLEMLQGLDRPRPRPFDLGRVVDGRGETSFLEAAGFGLYAELLARYRPDEGKDVLRAIDAIEHVVPDFRAKPLRVVADGAEYHDEFLLVTLMNTPRMGLRIPLAPDADPSDGRLDLVMIRRRDGRGLLRYARELLQGTLEEDEDVRRISVRDCRIRGEGAVHVDDQVEASDGAERDLAIDVAAGALTIWLPRDAS